MTILFLLSELAQSLLEVERWSWNEEFILTGHPTSFNRLTIKHCPDFILFVFYVLPSQDLLSTKPLQGHEGLGRIEVKTLFFSQQ